VNPAADTPAGGPASPGGAAHAPSSTGDGSAAEGRWAFGRWSLEVRGDELADVRCDGRVVLRAIRAVARDEDWATAWPRGATTRTEPDTLELHLRIADLGLDLAGTVHVAADGDRLVVDLDLEALTDSPTNRIGLVVLHPPQLAGTPLQVTHSEGAVEELSFPVQVSPHQPAKDIAGLAWEADRVSLRLDLAGDVFEMEDQRNWTDASFKTYSRPLDLPFPYTVSAGEHVRQQLVLTAVPSTDEAGAAPSGAGSTLTPSADGSPTARAGAPEELIWQSGGTVPAIGTGHLDLELADPDWSQRLDAALSARRSGDGAASSGGAAPSDTSLALWVVSSSPADPVVLAELGRRLAAAVRDGASFRFLGIADAARHVTTPDLAAALREVAPEGVPVVAGSRSHFTELNREWETVLAGEPEMLAFATTPLFHTLETEQLIEAVAMQRLLAEQLTARVPGLPVHVGPITLRPRFANVATRPQPVPAPVPPADPRAGTALHETWTVASAAALAVPGITSLTYEQVPEPLARLGGAASGAPTSAREDTLVTGHSVDGLVRAIGDGDALLLANLSTCPRRVQLPGRSTPLDLDPVSWSDLPARS